MRQGAPRRARQDANANSVARLRPRQRTPVEEPTASGPCGRTAEHRGAHYGESLPRYRSYRCSSTVTCSAIPSSSPGFYREQIGLHFADDHVFHIGVGLEAVCDQSLGHGEPSQLHHGFLAAKPTRHERGHDGIDLERKRICDRSTGTCRDTCGSQAPLPI